MKLKKGQKEQLLEWIAAGYRTDEINDRASECVPPFSISRRQVFYYRDTREADIDALIAAGEHEALCQGLALKAERVRSLKELAALMAKDLFGDLLWLDQVKGIGAGDLAQIVSYREFNKAEVDAYRGVLDDIAKELGHRVRVQEITGRDGADIGLRVDHTSSDEDLIRDAQEVISALSEFEHAS